MPTILVATDSDGVRESVELALVRPGHEIDSVRRGQDALARVVAVHPDLVILDLQIGNMGGVATALDLRLEAAAGRAPDVPVLLLLDRQADTFLGKRSEADALLVKPFDPGTLRRTVARLLEESPRRETTEEAPPAAEEAEVAGEAAASPASDPAGEGAPPA